MSLDVSLCILPRCKEQRTAENYSQRYCRYHVVPHLVDPASPDSSRPPLHVLLKSSRWGAQTREFSEKRLKICFDLRKKRVLTFLFGAFDDFYCHVTDSQVVSVLNKVMLEDRFANALKQPKLKPLKPLVKESRDAELVCTNLPDMLGPWVLRQEPLR